MDKQQRSSQDTAADTSARPRQLILACDGTNNTLTGGCHDTNVLALIGQLVPTDTAQILYYDPGVGSPDQVPPVGFINDLNRKRERVAGLAMGKGIYENIAEAYGFLIDHFQPGDQIYIFGFSRGAFTARCVAGMVNLFGIIRTESKPLILTLIRVYFSTPFGVDVDTAKRHGRKAAERAWERRETNRRLAEATRIRTPDPAPEKVLEYLGKKQARRSMREEVVSQVREKFTSPHGKTAVVHFVGVWDTVSSVGIPLLKREITGTGTTKDKPGLRHVRHALSMDEHRLSFKPRLYWDDDYPEDERFDPAEPSLRQRWFRGVHSDVGGGYDVNEAGLADEAYRWMLGEAIACGLRTVTKTERQEHAAKPYIAHDACHDTPWWGVAGLAVRTNTVRGRNKRTCRIAVRTAGAAALAHPKIYSVWSTGIERIEGRFWLAVAATLVCWLLAACLGYNGFYDDAATSLAAQAWQGAGALDDWQRTYVLRAITPYGAPAPASSTQVLWAIAADFAFIAAYSWLLGLYAAWAFTRMAARRRPDDKVSPLFVLGLAPMLAVLADVAENFLTILTLWLMPHGPRPVSILCGSLMMLANLAKWAGLAGSLALIGCGIAAGMHGRSAPVKARRRWRH